MKSLIIFAGAGASRSVSSEQYPTAIDFRKRLPEEVISSPLYKELLSHLEANYPNDQIDIEHILWELGALKTSLDELTKGSGFFKRLFQTNAIYNISSNISGPQTFQSLEILKANVEKLSDSINEQVYSLYSEEPEESELNATWLPLLKLVAFSEFEVVDIFTTNYDLVIEDALEKLDKQVFNYVDTGFIEGNRPRINLDAWNDFEREKGLLTKLHGSVDWKSGHSSNKNMPVIRRGHPEFDGDHSKRLILYPGFKGLPDREPFIAFHNYFKRKLRSATHILFIGFAFRDQFINELISEELSTEAKVAVVDPSEGLPNLKFLKDCEHFCTSFNSRDKASGTILTGNSPEPFPVSGLKIKLWLK